MHATESLSTNLYSFVYRDNYLITAPYRTVCVSLHFCTQIYITIDMFRVDLTKQLERSFDFHGFGSGVLTRGAHRQVTLHRLY